MELNQLIPNQGIPSGYLVEKFTDLPWYTMVTYPVSPHRTPGRYAPPRGTQVINSVVLTEWGGKKGSTLGGILETWKVMGFSAHLIIATGKDGLPIVVRWVDSNVSECQLAGPWDIKIVGGLVQTDGNQEVSNAQIASLGEFIKFSNTLYATEIAYLGDWDEARHSGSGEGKIYNIDTVRKNLCLQKLPPYS